MSEEWFLAQVALNPVPVTELLATLEQLRSDGKVELAESWAEMLQDTLAERKQVDEALQALELRIRWASAAGRRGAAWNQEAMEVCGATWDQKALIEEAGFDRGVAPAEAVRRLRLLRNLRDGVLCYDRTWGLGVVLRVDGFYKRVEIDFERKLGHQLSLAYASETLQLVGEDHLLAWKKRRPEELAKLIVNKPGEVVRMTLHSFGAMTVTQLQAALVPNLMPEGDWKKFWERARRELKSDHSIVMPATRTETIRVLESVTSREEEWFSRLAKELNLDNILEAVEDLASRNPVPTLEGKRRNLVQDRLAYAMHGALRDDPGMRARLLMAAQTLGLFETLGGRKTLDEFLGPVVIETTLRQLPARLNRKFLRFLAEFEGDRVVELLRRLMSRCELTILNEVSTYLMETGREDLVATAFKNAFASRAPGIEMLTWISRFPEKWEAWQLAPAPTTMQFMLEALEAEANGNRLKAQNQLRERFSKPEWLKDWLNRLEPHETENLLLRIKDSAAWPTLDRQSVLAHLVKLRPELAPLLASRATKTENAGRGPVTSQRMFRERQQQLDRIVNAEIPRVAKDIAIARSYGDLRENFEYKAAKEAQSILFHRRDELMRQLQQVSPTDFKGYPTEKAGIATTVSIEYGDGRRERYHILGEWDSDTERGIISSTSRMAVSLIGRNAGDAVEVPSENGNVKCRLVEVSPLPEDIRAWAEGFDT
jgi:transcription elongation GreA/GreB family factor